MSVLLITHDLGVVNEIADRVVVMYAGEIVESGAGRTALRRPAPPLHPGAAAQHARPRHAGDQRLPRDRRPRARPARACPPACRFAPRCPNRIAVCDERRIPPLEPTTDDRELRCYNPTPLRPLSRCSASRGLTKRFPVARDLLRAGRRAGSSAVDDVDLDVAPGETLALVGESGCGKSTLARLILRLIEPTAGAVALRRARRAHASAAARCARSASEAQIVFQDPFGSLDPRMKVRGDRGRGHAPPRLARRRASARASPSCSSSSSCRPTPLDRFPHEFSGGQRQRI